MKCLTVVPQVQWLPRVPTSYYSSIFTIESKIIPELKDLIKVMNDPNSLMADDLISEYKNTASFESEKKFGKGV